MRKREYPMGSISSGTMRSEDLIPSFLWELKHLAKAHNRKDHINLYNEINDRIMQGDDDQQAGCEHPYYDSEDADYDLEALFDALNEYAAPYFYFGAHPGDGADYGWWLSDGIEYDFDGLKVSDLSEVPKDYAGEILHINDHGNVTLYSKARTQPPREIWAVV